MMRTMAAQDLVLGKDHRSHSLPYTQPCDVMTGNRAVRPIVDRVTSQYDQKILDWVHPPSLSPWEALWRDFLPARAQGEVLDMVVRWQTWGVQLHPLDQERYWHRAAMMVAERGDERLLIAAVPVVVNWSDYTAIVLERARADRSWDLARCVKDGLKGTLTVRVVVVPNNPAKCGLGERLVVAATTPEIGERLAAMLRLAAP